MPYVDREGTPEHTSHFESCGCAEAREAALRAECERLKARGAELEAALTEIHELLSNYRHGKAKARAAAALKGDTSEIRRRASPDDKHPEDRIVH
jgi:hypothetical protein